MIFNRIERDSERKRKVFLNNKENRKWIKQAIASNMTKTYKRTWKKRRKKWIATSLTGSICCWLLLLRAMISHIDAMIINSTTYLYTLVSLLISIIIGTTFHFYIRVQHSIWKHTITISFSIFGPISFHLVDSRRMQIFFNVNLCICNK